MIRNVSAQDNMTDLILLWGKMFSGKGRISAHNDVTGNVGSHLEIDRCPLVLITVNIDSQRFAARLRSQSLAVDIDINRAIRGIAVDINAGSRGRITGPNLSFRAIQ